MASRADLDRALKDPHPEVARRAGRDRFDELLERLVALARPLDPAPAVLASLLVTLGQERGHVLRSVESETAVLRAAAASGQADRAVDDVLARISSPSERAADRRARGRWLDASAVQDRLVGRRHAVDQRWELLAVSVAAGRVDVVEATLRDALRRNAREIALDALVRWPVRVAAVRLLSALGVPLLPEAGAAEARATLVLLAEDGGQDPWVQVAAAEGVVATAAHADGITVLRRALSPSAGVRLHRDHRFARARLLGLAADQRDFATVRQHATSGDPSEHVVMSAVRALARSSAPADVGLVAASLAPPDGSPRLEVGWRVAAAGGVALIDRLDGDERVLVAARLAPALTRTTRAEVLRVLLDALWARRDRLRGAPEVFAPGTALADAVRVHTVSEDADARRLASVLSAWVAVAADPARAAALDVLAPFVRQTEEGGARRFTSGPVAALPGAALLDVLYVLAHEDLDLSARPLRAKKLDRLDVVPPGGWEVHVGLARVRTPWRMLHELSHPRNDKRQAFLHTVDEVPRGPLVAWSGRMAEVVATEVPGRRVSTPVTLAWDEHLPLPASLLVAARDGVAWLRTPEGVLDVRAGGWSAGWRVHRAYVELATLRTRLAAIPRGEAVVTYDRAVGEVGYRVGRPSVASLALLPAGLGSWLSGLGVSESHSAAEIAAVSVGSMVWWTGTKALREARVRRWRRALPLVVGGWGSRGKSSVERLKAAMFHGLGYSVLCKSTGCEAMLLVAVPGADAQEVFLYRPRDKATIVEQQIVLSVAATLRPQVTLYECMALNPMYTHILQQEWMRDDVTTITNTYPDHEDIQGPSGRDVADVISVFTPTGGRLVTSEHHMTPVLERAATRNGSSFAACRPEQWDLLPRDLLDRFPDRAYDRNVALVAEVGASLGIPWDVSVRTMADHVLVDLGAYKRYGPLPVEGRSLSFLCGNSANDRASFLSNWDRADLDTFGPTAGLDEWLVCVLNNRADRLARQAIFARIAAMDVSAERTVIIGTNVLPMAEQITAAFADALAPRLREIGHGTDGRDKLMAAVQQRLRRRPLSAAQADALLAEKAPATPDATWTEVSTAWREEVTWLHGFVGRQDWRVEELVDGCVRFLARRVAPFGDPKMSGDQILARIAGMMPDGATGGCSAPRTSRAPASTSCTAGCTARRCSGGSRTCRATSRTARAKAWPSSPHTRAGACTTHATRRARSARWPTTDTGRASAWTTTSSRWWRRSIRSWPSGPRGSPRPPSSASRGRRG